ncbi:Type I Polyketide synthase [Bulinus truncatus]|nr:Type I Polyketide synthase [Bulinus truncatus]
MPETTENPAPEAEAAETKPAETPAPVAPVKEMKSVVLTGFGGVKMMKVQQKPEATAGEGEVLIRVKACGMSFPDLMVRQGVIDHPPKTPIIMGFECAGVVEAVGANVTDFNNRSTQNTSIQNTTQALRTQALRTQALRTQSTQNTITQNTVTQNTVTQNTVTQNTVTQSTVTQNTITQNLRTQNTSTQNTKH